MKTFLSVFSMFKYKLILTQYFNNDLKHYGSFFNIFEPAKNFQLINYSFQVIENNKKYISYI